MSWFFPTSWRMAAVEGGAGALLGAGSAKDAAPASPLPAQPPGRAGSGRLGLALGLGQRRVAGPRGLLNEAGSLPQPQKQGHARLL